MSIDSFLKLEGVKGESQVKGFEGQLQLLAWSWGMSQSGTTHEGTGGGASKASVQDLSLTRRVDSASPTLILSCVKGKHFPSATLTMRKAGGDAPLPYLIITLTDLIVTSVSTGSSGGEDFQTENVSLNFAAFEYSYQPQNNKGAKEGGAITVKYNIAKND